MKSKIFLKGPKFFDSSENKMKNEGDVLLARSLFLKKRHNNVDFLLKERFSWMNKYLKSNMKIIEIGSGAGFSEFYLDIKPILTDMIENPWIEKRIDALNISYPEKSIDIIIASHNIHHFSSPYKFLAGVGIAYLLAKNICQKLNYDINKTSYKEEYENKEYQQ